MMKYKLSIILFLIFSFLLISNSDSKAQATKDLIAVTEGKILLSDVMLYRDEEGRVPVDLGETTATLNIDNKRSSVYINNVPEGRFHRASFKIQPPNEDIIVNDPDFTKNKSSVILQGYYNGKPFTYWTDVVVNKTIIFQDPMEVVTDGSMVFYLEGDPKMLFKDKDGNVLDPYDSNNRSVIDKNIEYSIRPYVKASQD